jgi:hypothetical protein
LPSYTLHLLLRAPDTATAHCTIFGGDDGRLYLSQSTSKKKPPFSGPIEPLAKPAVAFRLRQFLFGVRAALGRCKHFMLATSRRSVHTEMQGG